MRTNNGQTMKRRKVSSILFVAAFSLLGSCCPKGSTNEPLTHYLFAYFTSNETVGQQVCYAVSENGLDFTPLNEGQPVIAADTISRSGGVRDPHLLRAEDGRILMSLTDMDWQRGKWTCRGIVLMQSDDLISWKHATIDFPTRYAGEDAALADAV